MNRPQGYWVERPQEILPRVGSGCDWGRDRRVVLRFGPYYVFWVPGHNGWVSQGTSGYYPGSLYIGGTNLPYWGSQLAEKGRLSTHLRDPRVREEIAKVLKVHVTLLPELRDNKTFRWVGEVP